MSVFCMSEGGIYRKTLDDRLEHMEFVLDSEDDVATLPTNTTASELDGEIVGPCAPGSIALIPSKAAIYVMDNTGAWHPM